MSLKIRFLLLLLSFTAMAATIATTVQAKSLEGPSPRIIGGVDAGPNDYPWAVALLFSNETDPFRAQFCGGTLIADRWVLTAAHCLDFFSSASEIEVAVGIADLDAISSNDRISVSRFFVHPHYDTELQDNDIALLELSTPSAQPVLTIADNNLTNSINVGDVGDAMTVIGWGSLIPPPQIASYPALLQEVDVPLFDFSNCNFIYDSELSNNMICAGFPAGGKDTCQGDSGGPILYFNPGDSTYYQTGITSFGNGCAEVNNPGVYTRAANYLGWINGTITFAADFPDGYPFSYQGAGVAPTQVLTLTNNSGTDITVTNVSLTTMTNFIITGQTCTTGSIANNSSCTISLKFQTTGTGPQFDTLNIDLATGASFSSPVSGTVFSVLNNSSPLDEVPARIWYSGGDAPWLATSVTNSNNNNALRSASIGTNQNSALLAYFNGPDTLSFRWKASTEQDYDYLKLYIDGSFIARISGEQDWQQRNIFIPTGQHRVTWVYKKDNYDPFGVPAGTAWLDSVNTSYSGPTGSSDPVITRGFGSGGGAFGGLWLLLLTVMLLLRKTHDSRAFQQARR